MTKKICRGLIVLALLHCALSGRVAAQNPCLQELGSFWNETWIGLPLFNCSVEGPTLENCFIWTNKCAPADAAAETCPTCNQQPTQAGKPISLASGNTFIKETDVRVPGLSGGLTLVRTWNSLWPTSQAAVQVGLFGPNWRCNFEEKVFIGSDNYLKYGRGDGSFWSFGFAGFQGGNPVMEVAAPANGGAEEVNFQQYFTITFTNGEKRNFDKTTGNLVQIVDRIGNTTQLTYDSVDRLVTITDPVSRHLYFSYANGSSFLVTAVTSDFGISLSYTYDTQGRLLQVTNPDSSTLTFAYDSNSFIASVTDSQSKILESHTYDSTGHGLTSSRALGVDAITLTYNQ